MGSASSRSTLQSVPGLSPSNTCHAVMSSVFCPLNTHHTVKFSVPVHLTNLSQESPQYSWEGRKGEGEKGDGRGNKGRGGGNREREIWEREIRGGEGK